MDFFKRLRRAFSSVFRSKSKTTEEQWRELRTFLGLDGTDDSELSEATYFACLKVLSEAVGKLPLKLLKYNENNGVDTARKHALFRVVHDRPNPYMTSTHFWSTVEYNRNHHGNAYAWIKGAGGKTTLWILPSDEVEVWYDDAQVLADIPDIYYIYSAGGKRYCFGSEEILHFKGSNSFDGITGIAVRDQLKQSVGGNIKAQKLVNKLYDTGFTGKAVLQFTGQLNEANQKAFTAGIQKYIDGEYSNENIKNLIPLPYGATLEPFNLKLSDNQFFEIKQYTALQIASAFGIKPYQIGDYTKSSYASAEAQQLSFYIDTLLYIVKQYEEEITYKLLSDQERADGLHFKFNIDVILRADFATKINTLSTATNSFLMTPNEARRKLDLPSVPGGDALLGNGASIPVELTGSQYKTTPEETDDDPGGTDPTDETENNPPPEDTDPPGDGETQTEENNRGEEDEE